MINNPYKKTF